MLINPPAAYTRTCEESTGKYNLKVRATPAEVRLAKERYAQLKSLSWYLFTRLA